jgi:AAA+ superfamily predicted ATPase
MNHQPDWSEANRCHLMAAVALVQAKLAAHFGIGSNRLVEMEAEFNAAEAEMRTPAALELLSEEFGLSPFERDIVVLCAGAELDGNFEEFLQQLPPGSGAARITFSLALAALDGAHWNALSPDAPLRYWHLVDITSGDRLVHSPLRLDERVLHFLTAIPCLDARLESCLERAPVPSRLPGSHQRLAEKIATTWSSSGQQWPIIQLCGPDAAANTAIAASACNSLGMKLHVLNAGDLPASATDRHQLLRLWQREAVLSDSGLLVEFPGGPQAEAQRFAERAGGAVMVSTNEPLAFGRQAAFRFDVSKPTAAEQRRLWDLVLGETRSRLNGDVDAVIAQFDLTSASIDAAARLVGAQGDADPKAVRAAFWEVCRSQVNSQVGNLAQLIDARASWDDLVLPAGQKEILCSILAHVRHRPKVYERWGFAARNTRGLGISALFSGPSGTGKTMAAEVLSRELGLDLYRIDLSAVVSKYIGETEKNLRRIFDAAESGGAVLLFDEADALFGKRSEVKDSHDRYANIEVSYLLQRVEAYRGLAILTTNLKHALDSAFVRRLRFIVHFPFPDARERAEIWKRIFPPETPTQNLDAEKLARLNVAGGNIRNIAMSAAFLAAEEGTAVEMRHLLAAARAESVKLERPLTETEIAQWT